MDNKDKIYWSDMAMLASDSKDDLLKSIKNSESRLADIYGWRAVFTYRIFTIIRLFWVTSNFEEEVKGVFLGIEEHIANFDGHKLKKLVHNYNELLDKYRSDIIKLYSLVDAGSTADPETRFNAYTFGGRIG